MRIATAKDFDGTLKFKYENGNKFCATNEQHDYRHSYDPNSILGDSYDCIYCDDFQVG
jgi:hypothetical protein